MEKQKILLINSAKRRIALTVNSRKQVWPGIPLFYISQFNSQILPGIKIQKNNYRTIKSFDFLLVCWENPLKGLTGELLTQCHSKQQNVSQDSERVVG